VIIWGTFTEKKFAPMRFVSQGRPSVNSNLFRSEKLEQIFFHEFFAWISSKSLASHKYIYEHKDLDTWFSTNRTFDPSWRFVTFDRLRGLRRPLNCSQILVHSFEHFKNSISFPNMVLELKSVNYMSRYSQFSIKNQRNHDFSEKLKNSIFWYFHIFELISINLD
jgi:hypothetical protein